MCKDKISFTIPNEPGVLEATGNMLLQLAGKHPVAFTSIPTPEPEAVEPPVHFPQPDAPAAVPPAPVPPAAPAPPVSNSPVEGLPPAGELDVAGHPWDARIHASTKTKYAAGGSGHKQEGAWKLKRGAEEAQIAQLHAEWDILASVPVAQPQAPPVAPPAAVPPAPVPPAAPAPPVASEIPQDFPALVAIITAKQTSGAISPETVTAVVQSCGLPSFPALAAQQDKIPEVFAALELVWATPIAS